MLNAIDISPSFSPDSLQILADALLLAASQNYPQAQPQHLIPILNQSSLVTAALTSLKQQSLSSQSPLTASPPRRHPDQVSFSQTLKKIIYQTYKEMLLTNQPRVIPLHFLIPLNDYLTEPVDKAEMRKFIQKQNPSSDRHPGHSSTPTLEQYSINLTRKAQAGQIDPVIGRDQEISQLIRVLARRTKSNAILLGDPGVGKTAIVEGLALKISQNEVPKLLKNVTIYNLNLTSLLAGTAYQGELEQRLQNLINEVKHLGNTIIFIDEIHMIMGAGAGVGSMTAANILKPALARGDLNVIGATTQNEYRQYIAKDSALERRFEPVKIEEPSPQATLKILTSVSKKLTQHHGVTIDKTVLQAAIDLSSRYVQDRFQPDKAIDLLDEATSGAKISGQKAVTVEDLKKILSQRTGIPITSLTKEESLQLLNLENQIKTRIIGQDQAVKDIADVIKRARAGLKDSQRPIGSFLLLGPTGVGKTELAKVLAETIYKSDQALVRLDMSEFTEAHTADKLIGAPPGYVGYEEGGQLTNPIRHRPYSLILLDELEKAHPKVFEIFLQILEDGRLTDSQGHTADFKNTIIIITSNIDVSQFQDQLTPVDRPQLMKALTSHFRPEFLNRIDDIIIMNKLQPADIKKIARLQLDKLSQRLQKKKITLTIPDETLEKLSQLGNVQEFGARPLRRLIQNHIEEPIAEMIISKKLKSGDSINWTADKIK